MNFGLTLEELKSAKTKLLKKGLVPIPAHISKKHPLGDWKNYSVKDWNKSVGKIYGAKANIGVLTGSKSGVIVVDVDNKVANQAVSSEMYRKTSGLNDWNVLCEANGGEPQTLRCQTPSGGRHYYFVWDETLAGVVKTTNSNVMSIDEQLCAIDIRGDGGFVMCPPSISNFQTGSRKTF
ncbi:hypothetical protein DFS34DRAFT_629870 [Phlyctochytrium arcticum]|nr:hypothetical protein DFS34DRAFT_629870 [Phlyctochytrium arcticum]